VGVPPHHIQWTFDQSDKFHLWCAFLFIFVLTVVLVELNEWMRVTCWDYGFATKWHPASHFSSPSRKMMCQSCNNTGPFSAEITFPNPALNGKKLYVIIALEKQIIVARNQCFADERRRAAPLFALSCFWSRGTWTLLGQYYRHLSDGARGILFMAFTLVLVPLSEHVLSS